MRVFTEIESQVLNREFSPPRCGDAGKKISYINPETLLTSVK